MALRYIVERSRNRTSRAMLRGDAILIRLARGLRPHEEQAHIQSLLKSMVRVVAKEQRRTSIDPFRPLLNGERTMTLGTNLGTTHTLVLEPRDKATVRIKDNVITLGIPAKMDQRRLHRHLWNVMSDVLHSQAAELVRKVNDETVRVHWSGLSLRYMQTQWGSCSSRGKITLNPALFFVDSTLLEYVILHELTHREHQNHSKRFWALVEAHCVNFSIRKKNLNHYRISRI